MSGMIAARVEYNETECRCRPWRALRRAVIEVRASCPVEFITIHVHAALFSTSITSQVLRLTLWQIAS
jgi:hypothetical protein